jgi:hypothetical protein
MINLATSNSKQSSHPKEPSHPRRFKEKMQSHGMEMESEKLKQPWPEWGKKINPIQ